MGGMKFATTQLLPPLTPAKVVFTHAPGITFEGVVMWSGRIDLQFTAGLKFDNLTLQHRQILATLL